MNDDYVRVPVKPTPEMIEAGHKAGFHVREPEIEFIYRAMLSAAPKTKTKTMPEQPQRATWKTDGGRTCLNCGKSIVSHEDQTFCPVAAQPQQEPDGYMHRTAHHCITKDPTAYDNPIPLFRREKLEQPQQEASKDAQQSALRHARNALEGIMHLVDGTGFAQGHEYAACEDALSIVSAAMQQEGEGKL